MDKAYKPLNQIWIAFNQMPGGHIIVQHFEDTVRKQKVGDQIIDHEISSKEQVAAFKKSDFVALNINGRKVKNEVLIYQERDLSGNPKAADVVIEWAKGKGLQPIQSSPTQEQSKPFEYDKRIATIEKRLDGQDEKLDKILRLVGGVQPQKQ